MSATRETAAVTDDSLVLGRYRLGRRLGSGGFGAVHEAVDELLERWVAVKVIPAEGSAPERARREAQAAARLDHPGIVAIYDAGEEPGARYLVSELVEGSTLAALESAGELSDRDVLRVGLSLADALRHAHERGVVHRDLKPQNVLVPDRPRSWRDAAKLADFGVAHLAGGDPLTMTGDVVGTLAYMAPEQAAGRRVDARADLYSLALVLYEALCGFNPVRRDSPAQTVRALGSVLPPLRKQRPDLPEDLAAALDRALRPAPAERGSVDDLADALERAIIAVPDDGGTIVHHPLERRPRGTFGLRAARALARLSWLGAMVAAVGLLPPGIALLAVLALAPVPLLLRRAPLLWPLPLLAPLLAGAFPAVAGVAGRWHQRAALGALGAWWLLLCEPVLERSLLLGPAPGVAARARFDSGASLAAADVVAPVVSSGLPLVLALWAVAAVVMPWLVRGRSLSLDLVAATGWTACLAAGTAAAGESLLQREPRGLVLFAVAAAAIAVAQPRYFAP